MKKNLFLTVMSTRKKSFAGFRGLIKRNFISFIICLLFIPGFINAQSIGNWTFDNILTGTPGTHNTVSAASLGSALHSVLIMVELFILVKVDGLQERLI